MSEAKEGCAILEDIDEDTFVRFSQFAYTGDYVAANPKNLLDPSAVITTHLAPKEASEDPIDSDEILAEPPAMLYDEPAAAADDWNSFSISKKDKKRGRKAEVATRWEDNFVQAPTVQSRKSRLWNNFKSKVYTTSQPAFQPRKNLESCEEYTQVLLCHAQLYVFADKYDVGTLKMLSLHKLQRTLVEFTLYDERTGDIVDLLRYSYTNTVDRPEPIDELRLLVVHYAACIIEKLAWNTEFRLLLEQGGSLARDLIGQMVERLD
ncbi:MAG: hypothetical protein Q9201_002601 [Fulgogasparrea decipioides]